VKKPSLALFITRLLLYLSAAALPFAHPGILVSYDRIGFVQWFIIIPFEALIAFLPAPRGKIRYTSALALCPLAVISVWAGGFGLSALPPLCAGLLSFALTFLLFHYPRWGKLSAVEPFVLAWVCLRLLAFSRSGEEAAGQSLALTQFILVWTAAVFLFHSAVVYFCLYPQSRRGGRKEGAVFALAVAAALIAVICILPPDFVRNTVVENLLPDRIQDKSKLSDSDYGIPGEGGGRRKGRGTVPGDREGRRPGLRELSEYDWPGQGRRGKRGNGEGESRQYTVMVAASKQEPVYMGNSFRGLLDPGLGFLPSPDEPLNLLPARRFFVTWFNDEPVRDQGRERWEVFSLSTLPQHFLPYYPAAIEPTVLSEKSGPLRYIHRVFSDTHTGDPLELVFAPVRNLNSVEKSALDVFLALPLNGDDREAFTSFFTAAMEGWEEKRAALLEGKDVNEYMEKILALLVSFSDYQYNLSDNESASIAELITFLRDTKDGDCVEFSNSLALLGRFAGIPSRVVTGYLAAESLQTTAHLRGLAALRGKIPLLQEFPFEDLYLVTDAHSHSWTQFYVPDYGWLDFEATAFAIPPIGFGDANLRDVVIPMLDERRVFSQVRAFPWRALLRAVLFLSALALICAYALRYGREAALWFGSRRGGRRGARFLYLLLLAKLAADGRPIKPASRTAREYAELFPADAGAEFPFAAFAALYAELRWRQFPSRAGENECFRRLLEEYRKILKAYRRRGFPAFCKRFFNLRGLAYL
jgi:hypothetical protein